MQWRFSARVNSYCILIFFPAEKAVNESVHQIYSDDTRGLMMRADRVADARPCLIRWWQRRRASPGAALFIAVLALFVTWHHVYVPLHLIAHEHFNGADLVTGDSPRSSACSRQPHGGQNVVDFDAGDDHRDSHPDDDHKRHPAHDHLAGYFMVSASALHLILASNVDITAILADHPAPAIPLPSPHERGPPGSYQGPHTYSCAHSLS